MTEHFFSWRYADIVIPPRHLVAADVGLGKTRSYIEVLPRLVEELKSRHAILITVPTHELAGELVARIADTGLDVGVYRGPRQPDPDCPEHHMCRRHANYAVFQAAGAQATLCKACEHSSFCGYQRQKKLKPDIWIAPHNILFHRRVRPIPPIDFLIVDEDPTSAGFEPRSVVMLDEDAPRELARAMQRLPLDGALCRSDVGLSDQQVHRLEKDLWKRAHRVKLAEDADEAAIEAATALAAEAAKDIAHAKLLQAIRRNDAAGMRCYEDEDGRRLEWTRQRRIHNDFIGAPTLFVDATPNWDRLRQLYDVWQAPPGYIPDTFIDEDGSVAIEYLYPLPPVMAPVREIRVETPHAQVRQVVYSAAKGRLFNTGGATRNLPKLQRYIVARSARYSSVLVICQKDVEDWLLGYGLPGQVATAHFNAIRGRDEWQDVDLLIVIGRTQPPVQVAEIHAEALFGLPVQSILPAYYDAVWQPLTGVGRYVRAEQHPDPLAEMMRFYACEDELIQAIGRGRAVNRTADNPLQIDIINQVPLPNIEVNEVLTWNEAMPDARAVILGQYGLLLPAERVPGWAGVVHALVPDMFGTEKAARQGKLYSLTNPPNKDLYIGEIGSEYSVGGDLTLVIGLQVKGARYMVPALVVRPDFMHVDETGHLVNQANHLKEEEEVNPSRVMVKSDLTRRWHERLRSPEERSRLWPSAGHVH